MLELGSDHRFRQLIQDLLAFSTRLQAIREEFGRIAGISGSQYSLIIALAHLSAGEAGITVSLLAEQLHVSGTYVTAETNKLQRAGYLQRSPNPRDKRSVLLTLTDSGLKLLDRLLPTIQRINDEIFRDLSRAEFKTLQSVMARLARSVDHALALAEGYRRAGATP